MNTPCTALQRPPAVQANLIVLPSPVLCTHPEPMHAQQGMKATPVTFAWTPNPTAQRPARQLSQPQRSNCCKCCSKYWFSGAYESPNTNLIVTQDVQQGTVSPTAQASCILHKASKTGAWHAQLLRITTTIKHVTSVNQRAQCTHTLPRF
jgi:hypothetical protein